MDYQLAVADFKKVLSFEPNNETVRSQLVSTQKLIRKIEFEKVDLGTASPLSHFLLSLFSRPSNSRERSALLTDVSRSSKKVHRLLALSFDGRLMILQEDAKSIRPTQDRSSRKLTGNTRSHRNSFKA